MNEESGVVLYDQFGNTVKDTRSLAFSKALMPGMPRAQFTKWTIEKAVKDGLKSSVWIFRSFGLITGSAAGVHLRVVNQENDEPVENHPLNKVLEQPNNQISRYDCMSLLYNWLLLAGLAYMLVGDGKSDPTKAKEFPLWPVCPDRIFPLRNKEVDLMIDGYCKFKDRANQKPEIKYTPEQIIPFRIMDPANPLLGMSPLFAAARTIDTDAEMENFNKSAMQNMGVVDGIVGFKQPMGEVQLKAQAEAFSERHQGSNNAKRTAFFGSDVTYKRTSMTPQEADFAQGKKDNRDKILSAVGTPPQLVGAQESSTMDNYRTSETIHWRNTIVPLINVVVNQFNFFFTIVKPTLRDGEVVAPDYSDVQALQQNFKEKTFAAEKLFKIGTPVKTISSMLKLGIIEYEGWDLPYNGRDVKINPATGQTTIVDKEKTGGDVEEDEAGIKKKASIFPIETRRMMEPMLFRDREKVAETKSKAMAKILKNEEGQVMDVLETSPNPMDTLTLMFQEDDPFETAADWDKVLTETARQSAIQEGKSIIIEQRAFDDELATAIDEALENEGVILQERSYIMAHTADLVTTVVADGLDAGASISELSAALADTGLFSSERALRISRTIAGTGSSMGQLAAGTMSGATHKTWSAASDARDLHQNRDNETVKIAERFTGYASDNGSYPRYPLDPDLAPGDRINCRCSMTFSTKK